MKIQYGIAGFVFGIMSGLLIGLAEMKLFMRLHHQTIIPFAIGITVIICAVAGVRTGVKMAARNLRK